MFPFNLDLPLVIAFQSIGDWLVAPMKFFSFLGAEEFYILIFPILYWSIDAKLGILVGASTLFSGGLNFILKIPFLGPRPYWISTNVKPLWGEIYFGIPSGHAQNSVVVWGTMASYLRKIWAWVIAIFLILMIGLSRVYLGAHFVIDTVAGWLVGALLLWLLLHYWDTIVTWAKKQSLGQQIGYAFLVSAGMVLVGWLFIFLNRDFVIPETWIVNASRAGGEEIAPLALSTIITPAATLFGLLAGIAWLAPRGGWQASGPVWMRASRYLVGLIGVLVIWYGLGLVFPRGEALLPIVLRYVRYSLLGLWVTAGAPLVFMKLKLS